MSESELEVKVFTRKEVEEYKSIEKGIYLIIHNQVYDVTKFLEEASVPQKKFPIKYSKFDLWF